MSNIITPCSVKTSGGKGNIGMFIDRDPKVFAAGVRTIQEEESVSNNLKQYLLQDEVDALIHDAVIPTANPKKLLPLRIPLPKDMRNASTVSSEGSLLINPPMKSKVLYLMDDLKEANYKSYWKKPVGRTHDQVPNLPAGTNIYETTFGKKTQANVRAYDIICPKIPVPDQVPKSKAAGSQLNRNYLKPAFNKDMLYGKKYCTDPRGILVKNCLTDELNTTVSVISSIQVDKMNAWTSRIGKSTVRCDVAKCVPKGHAFGLGSDFDPHKTSEWATNCELNPKGDHFRKCFSHLNKLRKCLSNRGATNDASFYKSLYLQFKFLDTFKTGWLPKETIYNICNKKFILFDPVLIEPLLACWKAFNGHQIEYKTFVHVINNREPSPELPKVWDVPEEYLEFRTTYGDMFKLYQEKDERPRAGVPSGRYFDRNQPVTPSRYCRADRFYLPDETDTKACLNPSILGLLGVTHRDMYCQRNKTIVRGVFELVGEIFTDESFEEVWDEAKKYHSRGLVCFETFKRALNKINAEIKGK